jgi:hypothetical protein
VHRDVDHACHHVAGYLGGDADRPVGQPVKVVDGAVERVDDPAHPPLAGLAAFLTQHGVAGPRSQEPAGDEPLRGLVHLGDHVCR